MTVDEYYSAVKSLGLTPTACPTVFLGRDGLTYNVPNPVSMPEDVRAETIRRIRANVTGS